MYVNHIFSLRLKRYGSQKKAARMAAEGVQKMSKYVKPVISLDEGMAEGVYAASCIFRKNCASVPEERSAIPLQTEQSSAG